VDSGVDIEVSTVSVEVAEPLIEAGLKLAVAPEGRLLMPRATGLAKPFMEEVEIA